MAGSPSVGMPVVPGVDQRPSGERSGDLEALFEVTPCALCGNDTDFEPVLGSRADIYLRKFGLPVARSRWMFCRRCGLLFQNPRPRQDIIMEFYRANRYFGSGSATYHALRGIAVRKHEAKLDYALYDIQIGTGPPLRAADIGCGIGGCVALMRSRGLDAMGVEPDPVVAEWGRRELGVSIIEGLLDRTVLSPSSLDFVYTNHVFEHLYDPNLVMSVIRAALADSGRIFVCVPTYKWNSSFEAYEWQNLSHNYLFTHRTLAALFQKHGFAVVRYRYRSASNELWMLGRKQRILPSAVAERSSFTLKELWDYRCGVPCRALLFLPARVSYHLSEMRQAAVSESVGSAVNYLAGVLRLLLANSYRRIQSFGRSLRVFTRGRA